MSSQFTTSWYLNKLAQQNKGKSLAFLGKEGVEAVRLEGKLHQDICNHCDAQWPRWKVIHARMDKKNTIGIGVHDFTVFLPRGRMLCIECKAGNEKLTHEQLVWRKELEFLGHTVHVVRSMQEFLTLVETQGKDT